MSEHHFGVGQGRPKHARRIESIAKKHDAAFTWAELPGEGWRYWFSCRNNGFPFDRDTERAVKGALEAVGLWPIPVHEGAKK